MSILMDVSPETAERLWRQFARLAQAHYTRASEAKQAGDEAIAKAMAFRELVPAERLEAIDAERLARAKES